MRVVLLHLEPRVKPSLLQKRTRRRDLAFNSIRTRFSASRRTAAAALARVGVSYISHYADSLNKPVFKVTIRFPPSEERTHNPHI